MAITAPLRVLLGDYDWSRPLKAAGAKVAGVQLQFDAVSEASTRFKPLLQQQAYDAAELAVVAFLQAKAYGKPFVLLPVVVLGNFHHKSIAYNVARGAIAPTDLQGKRVGVRSYAQTTGVWVRGILQHEYDVDLGRVTWVTQEDAHLSEYRNPPNCVRGPEGRSIVEMLLAGELDAAMLGMNMPKDDRIRPVIADPVAAAAAWQAKYHAMPINHMFVVSSELAEARPDVVRGIYDLFAEARRDSGFPLGLEADWSALELASQYAFEQRIIPRPYTAGELFEDAARILKL